MPSEDVAEFGGWPRPPRWVWAVAGITAVAVLAGVVVARTGPHHAAASSRPGWRPPASSPVRGARAPAAGSAARWPSAAGACGSPVYLPQIHLARHHASCPREGAGRWHGAAAGHPRPCRVQAAARAAGSRPAGHKTGRRAGRRLRRRLAMQQFQPIPEGLPDRGWRPPPPQHDRRRLARRPPPRVGGDLPGTPYGAHCADRGPGGHAANRTPPRSPTPRPA